MGHLGLAAESGAAMLLHFSVIMFESINAPWLQTPSEDSVFLLWVMKSFQISSWMANVCHSQLTE